MTYESHCPLKVEDPGKCVGAIPFILLLALLQPGTGWLLDKVLSPGPVELVVDWWSLSAHFSSGHLELQ